VFEELADPPDTTAWLLRAGLGVLAAAGAAALSVPAVRRWLYPPLREDRLRDHILFDRVLSDGRTIRCVGGALVRVIAVRGTDLSALREEEREAVYLAHKKWVEKLADHKAVAVLRLTLRRFHGHEGDTTGYEDFPWLERIQHAWHGGFDRSFRNSHAVVLWVAGGAEAGRRALDAAVEDSLAALRDFRPAVLELGAPGEASPLLSFWAALLNPGRPVKVLVPEPGLETANLAEETAVEGGREAALDRRLADRLIRSQVAFAHGSEEATEEGFAVFRLGGGGATVHMGALGVSTWGPHTSADIVRTACSVDAEAIVAQWIKVYDPAASQLLVRELKRRELTTRFSGRKAEQFEAAEQMVEARGAGQLVADHQMIVFVFGRGRKDAVARVRLVERAFDRYQVRAVPELAGIEPVWLAMFPPHGGTADLHRRCRLMSGNVAHLAGFDAPAQGMSACDWGPRPVTVFRTSSGSPYGFCWHISGAPLAVGHCVMIGGTGRGKTVLANFLAASSLGYPGARVFLFDRSDGSYVPVAAMGGEYVYLQSDAATVETACQLNPLHMDLSDKAGGGGARQWAGQWLRDHVCQTPDPESQDALTAVLETVAGLPRELRDLKEVYRNLPDAVPAKRALRRFVEGDYAPLFNGRRDTLDVDANRLVAFDFTRVLEDKTLVRALLPYLSYRIQTAMTQGGFPWLMVIDEAAALLGDPGFLKWYVTLHQEARKMRGVIVSCFQRIGSLVESGTLEMLRGQAPTWLLFPDREADPAAYMGALGLSQADFDKVTGRDPAVQGLERYVVVRREGEGTVVLDTNLAAGRMAEYLPLFASGPRPADRMRMLQRDGAGYVERYLRMAAA
jgi:hypothetical protein